MIDILTTPVRNLQQCALTKHSEPKTKAIGLAIWLLGYWLIDFVVYLNWVNLLPEYKILAKGRKRDE